MLYIETGSTDPAYNLAFEEYVLSGVGSQRDCFMLWQNENAVIIGRHQNTMEEINLAYVKANGIKVVRRLTGGGAVYHDLGNLNFSFITSADGHDGMDFERFLKPVIQTLSEFGVNAAFNGRNDMTIGGMKFSGSSQFVRRGRLLDHGTLLLDSDLERVADALRVREDKFVSKSAKSVRSRVTNINAHLPEPITVEQFKSLLLKKLGESVMLEPWSPTRQEAEEITALAAEKYSSWDWNFGKSPRYSINKRRRIEGVGSIDLSMEVCRGAISAISLYGDYFGTGEQTQLAEKLIGCSLEPSALDARLAQIDLGYYISGMSREDMVQLILI